MYPEVMKRVKWTNQLACTAITQKFISARKKDAQKHDVRGGMAKTRIEILKNAARANS